MTECQISITKHTIKNLTRARDEDKSRSNKIFYGKEIKKLQLKLDSNSCIN